MTRNIVLALVAALVAYSTVRVIEAVVPEQPPAGLAEIDVYGPGSAVITAMLEDTP